MNESQTFSGSALPPFYHVTIDEGLKNLKTSFNLNRTRLTGMRKETIIKILQPAKTFP